MYNYIILYEIIIFLLLLLLINKQTNKFYDKMNGFLSQSYKGNSAILPVETNPLTFKCALYYMQFIDKINRNNLF